MDTLSPRGEGKLVTNPNKQLKVISTLAPWGEGVHRTGEGLLVRLYDRNISITRSICGTSADAQEIRRG